MNLHLQAQTHRIDSLKNLIYASSNSSTKLDLLLELCKERNSLSADSLNKYAEEAKQLAIKQGDKLKSAWVDFYIAFGLLTRGLTDSSMALASAQLNQSYETATDRNLYVKFLLLKANALNRSSKTKEALELLYKLLASAELKGDWYTQLYVYNYIGTAYQIIDQPAEAQLWFYKAFRVPGIKSNVAYQESYSSALLNTGITYLSLFQAKGAERDGDSAAFYLTKAIALAKKNEYLSTVAYGSNMKGALLSMLKKPSEAEVFFKEGLDIRKQIGDPYYIISDIIALGDFYLNAGQPEKGVAICTEGIGIARKYKVTADLSGLYTTLADNYKASGDYAHYGSTLKELVSLKDSVYKKNSAEQLSEMQARYEVQQKENTIIQQQLSLTKKNYFIYGFVGLLIVTLLITYGILQNRKKRQRLKMQELVIDQNKKTATAVMQAEEEERKRIAGDLHDSVAQKMVVAKMNLESLGSRIKTFSETDQLIFNSINNLLEESTTEVRNLSHSMMPQEFSRSGLTDAVKEFLNKISDNQLTVHFSASGDFSSISENSALMIFRIIQECVQNVLKHAGASRLDLSMIAEQSDLEMTIEDNGKGFEMTLINPGSIGLKNIRSRVAYLGGKAEIDSRPGQGTVLAFHIPLSKH